MKLTNIETKYYKLVWGTLQGRGTYIIIDKKTDKSTLRNTGSDAINDYNLLKRIYNNSRTEFDKYVKLNCIFYED